MTLASMPTTLDREQIAARIPHSGAMCLLDQVVEWDAARIVCRSASHRDPGNPLRYRGGRVESATVGRSGSAGELAASCGIEYAAQAMAVHGGLVTRNVGRPRLGFLASVRSVELHVARLDDIASDLVIEAHRLSADGSEIDSERSPEGERARESRDDPCVLYAFSLQAAGKLLLEGRAAVVLDTGKLLR